MIELRNMTIKKKLTVVMMIASVAVVTLSCLIFMVSSFWLLRKDHVDKDLVLERLTGRNSQAALMFDVPDDAEKTLASLEADSSIIFACIYTPDGKPFAVYQRKGSGPEIEPPEMRDEGHEYSDGYLRIFHDIIFDGKKIGSIYLQDGQREVYASFRWDVITLVMEVGPALALYVDQETHMLTRMERVLPPSGQIECSFLDYAMVDGAPDQYVIESWLKAPSRSTPETEPWTFTRSVLDFSRRFAKRSSTSGEQEP